MQSKEVMHVIQKKQRAKPVQHGVEITPETVEHFLLRQRQKLLTEDTLSRYALGLQKLQAYLAPSGIIELGTLESWQRDLQKFGYSTATVNTDISIANNLLEFLRRGDLKAEPLPADTQQSPEITRAEYLRLLQTARLVENERAYLLIKLFGTVPLSANDLSAVTVEAVQTGYLQVTCGKTLELLYVPAALAEELLTYAQSHSISDGAIFRSRVGTLYSRSRATLEMQKIAQAARISPEKATPRALKKLCRKTLDEIDEKLRVLALQNYEALLGNEQQIIGWREL